MVNIWTSKPIRVGGYTLLLGGLRERTQVWIDCKSWVSRRGLLRGETVRSTGLEQAGQLHSEAAAANAVLPIQPIGIKAPGFPRIESLEWAT